MFSDIWFILSTRLWSRLILAITHIHIPMTICCITLLWSKLFFQWSGKPQKQLTITKHSKQTWKLELWRVCSLSVYHNMPEKEEKLRRKLQHTDNACVCLPQSSHNALLSIQRRRNIRYKDTRSNWLISYQANMSCQYELREIIEGERGRLRQTWGATGDSYHGNWVSKRESTELGARGAFKLKTGRQEQKEIKRGNTTQGSEEASGWVRINIKVNITDCSSS